MVGLIVSGKSKCLISSRFRLNKVRLSLPQKRIHHHESIRMSFQTPRGVDIDWH
ncbi:hypothetical protein F2Q70_00018080 [Brassica cretica]|uniref:Uncharacterized protein n=1 Tax=Brassica cretica TaxID=69181 RepID=A0A8S9I4P1_BRACR|nr:hypothetical protein F2Q70_00018080 [Brassica cretica]